MTRSTTSASQDEELFKGVSRVNEVLFKQVWAEGSLQQHTQAVVINPARKTITTQKLELCLIVDGKHGRLMSIITPPPSDIPECAIFIKTPTNVFEDIVILFSISGYSSTPIKLGTHIYFNCGTIYVIKCIRLLNQDGTWGICLHTDVSINTVKQHVAFM